MCSASRGDLIDATQHIVTELETSGGDGVVDVLGLRVPMIATCTAGFASAQATARRLTGTPSSSFAKLLERGHHAQVARKRVALEVRAVGSPVVF